MHKGTWFTTWHSEFEPQLPGHGSPHLLLIHALLDGQSVFITHSGLQLSYGFPKYPSIQEHAPALFFSLHIAFEPHGDGEQGVTFGSDCITS